MKLLPARSIATWAEEPERPVMLSATSVPAGQPASKTVSNPSRSR